MDKKTPSLKDLHEIIADLMFEDIEIGHGEYETNCFCYEEEGWYIEGCFDIEGYFESTGDGYWEPIEEHCVAATGRICELAVYYCDEDDNEIEIPQKDIDKLYEYLERELEAYCNNPR